jgi:hypothetical protein
MVGGLEWTFISLRYGNDHLAPQNLIIPINYWGYLNQNSSKIISHLPQEGYKNVRCIYKDEKELEHSYMASGIVNWYRQLRKQFGNLLSIKCAFTIWPCNFTAEYTLKELTTHVYTGCIWEVKAALLTIAKVRKPFTGPSSHEWTSKV